MIFVECNADEALLIALGISRKGITHAHSKGNICNLLVKNRNSKGMVDEDPYSSRPRYFERLKIISNEHSIKLLVDEKSQNHLIVLCPKLEDWVLKATKELKVDTLDYGLPDDGNKLHKIINIKLEDFKKLINDIKQESKMLKTLQSFLKNKI